jgi:hypothetical protein
MMFGFDSNTADEEGRGFELRLILCSVEGESSKDENKKNKSPGKDNQRSNSI